MADEPPFCVWYSASPSVSESQHGGELQRFRCGTLEEAKLAAANLPSGHQLLMVTEKKDLSEFVHWPSYSR
jgi:hypothetical protein